MPEFALAAAGAVVFALTTWASLAFGYQVFQNTWETDQADGAAPARPSDDHEAVAPGRDGAFVDGDAAHPTELPSGGLGADGVVAALDAGTR